MAWASRQVPCSLQDMERLAVSLMQHYQPVKQPNRTLTLHLYSTKLPCSSIQHFQWMVTK